MADNLETVKGYISFLMAQQAAESYLDGLGKEDLKFDKEDVEDNDYESTTVIGRLALGANHYNAESGAFDLRDYEATKDNEKWSATMATKETLNKFAEEWTIIDQRTNRVGY